MSTWTYVWTGVWYIVRECEYVCECGHRHVYVTIRWESLDPFYPRRSTPLLLPTPPQLVHWWVVGNGRSGVSVVGLDLLGERGRLSRGTEGNPVLEGPDTGGVRVSPVPDITPGGLQGTWFVHLCPLTHPRLPAPGVVVTGVPECYTGAKPRCPFLGPETSETSLRPLLKRTEFGQQKSTLLTQIFRLPVYRSLTVPTLVLSQRTKDNVIYKGFPFCAGPRDSEYLQNPPLSIRVCEYTELGETSLLLPFGSPSFLPLGQDLGWCTVRGTLTECPWKGKLDVLH